MNGNIILFLLIFGVIGFLVFKFYSKFKVPKTGTLTLVSGGVKCGKSTYSVYLCWKNWKRNHRRWRVRSWIQEKLGIEVSEEPLFYSNIPLAVPYVPITKDLLIRRKRFNYGSVVYLCEASLVADNMIYKDELLNDQYMLFAKLCGHELKGGAVVLDTQSIGDNPAVLRRCLSSYTYIDHLSRLPFFLVAHVREDRYSEDGSSVSVYDKDVDDSGLKKVLIPKKVWKLFDCYCYSSLTDNLPKVDNVCHINKDESLKVDEIVSFKHDKFNLLKKDGYK